MYLMAALKDWIVLIAGVVGIFFTISGLFAGLGALRLLFLVLAVVALQIAAYRVWRTGRQEYEELPRKLEPRLAFEYAHGEKPFAEDTEQADSIVGAVWRTHWIRVGVRNRSGTAVDRVSVV